METKTITITVPAEHAEFVLELFPHWEARVGGEAENPVIDDKFTPAIRSASSLWDGIMILHEARTSEKQVQDAIDRVVDRYPHPQLMLKPARAKLGPHKVEREVDGRVVEFPKKAFTLLVWLELGWLDDKRLQKRFRTGDEWRAADFNTVEATKFCKKYGIDVLPKQE